MIKIRWPDNHVDRAPTWDALFDLIRHDQWHRYTRRGFRKELARRAKIWSGTDVDPTLPLPDLFRALERAEMLDIVSEEITS